MYFPLSSFFARVRGIFHHAHHPIDGVEDVYGWRLWRAVVIIQFELCVLILLQRSGANRLIGQNQYRDSSIQDCESG